MIRIILLIIIAIGVTAIFDARRIAEKYFSSSDINKQVLLLKAVGFLVSGLCDLCNNFNIFIIIY